MASLLCPVRRCGAALRREWRVWACSRGHSFDVARSGYVNLLQPQERRSKSPGDSRDVAQARRRLADGGHEDWLLFEVRAELEAAWPRGRAACALDVGCGEGFLAGSLAREANMEAHGVDISVSAIELAAKRYPGVVWIVANADRFLPWADGSFDLVTSITARRNGPEIRRVLASSGRVVIAVPGPEDLIELREALLGRGARKDRGSAVIAELRPGLELLSRRTVARTKRFEAVEVRDLLAATYRGGRARERSRAAEIGPMHVTVSRDILIFGR